MITQATLRIALENIQRLLTAFAVAQNTNSAPTEFNEGTIQQLINVPAAKVLGLSAPGPNDPGLPMDISFIGTAFSEPTLITLASGFEAVTHARFQPTFVGDATTVNTAGTTLARPSKAVPKNPPHHM